MCVPLAQRWRHSGTFAGCCATFGRRGAAADPAIPVIGALFGYLDEDESGLLALRQNPEGLGPRTAQSIRLNKGPAAR